MGWFCVVCILMDFRTQFVCLSFAQCPSSSVLDNFCCDDIQIERVLLTFACVILIVVISHIIQKAARAISLVYPPTKIFVILSYTHYGKSSHLIQFHNFHSNNFLNFIVQPLRSISSKFFCALFLPLRSLLD